MSKKWKVKNGCTYSNAGHTYGPGDEFKSNRDLSKVEQVEAAGSSTEVVAPPADPAKSGQKKSK